MDDKNQWFIVDQSRPIHVLREAEIIISNWAFFLWLEKFNPRFAQLFHHTTAASNDLSPLARASLFIPWIQDPLKERNRKLFERISALEENYIRSGIPVLNPVRVLSNAIKSRALSSMRSAEVRTAHVKEITRATHFNMIAEEVGTPFIVRNDQGHGGYLQLVHNPNDFSAVDWDKLQHPLALEFIDTRCKDGFYRKYRYLLTGDQGITRHLVISSSWNVHAHKRQKGQQFIDEELACINSINPYHAVLNSVRKVLELDYVAFDYSIDNEGQLVVWEPNPFPMIWLPENEDPYYKYQISHRNRVFTQILSYYLSSASLLKKYKQKIRQL